MKIVGGCLYYSDLMSLEENAILHYLKSIVPLNFHPKIFGIICSMKFLFDPVFICWQLFIKTGIYLGRLLLM